MSTFLREQCGVEEIKVFEATIEVTTPASSGSIFFYVDARDTIGYYLEYVWMHPEMWTALGGR